MNHILKYLSFVLFGIIIYLLLRNRGEKERFSIGIQEACTGGDCINTNTCTVLESWTCNGNLPNCNFSLDDNELDWSTCKNPCCMPMIINYHDQEECETCSIYSIASLLECMYNIKVFQENRTDELPRISISPQSIIDILGRYKHLYSDGVPVYHNYHDDVFSDMEHCLEEHEHGLGRCGQYWSTYNGFTSLTSINTLKNSLPKLIVFAEPENAQEVIQLLENKNDNHFPFPLFVFEYRKQL